MHNNRIHKQLLKNLNNLPKSEFLLFLVGTSHKEAILSEREKFNLTKKEIQKLEEILIKEEEINECIVLNTCNRLEIYGIINKEISNDEILLKISNYPKLRNSNFIQLSYIKKGANVVKHIIKLASGLESQIVGETEILGQIKDAYKKSKNLNHTQKSLNRLFEKSFQVAKDIRSQTAITKGKISVSNIVVDLAKRIFKNLSSSRILIIGSGYISEKTAKALIFNGVKDITVTGRSLDKTRLLADNLGASTIHYKHLKSQIEHFDIIISATNSSKNILKLKDIEYAIDKRPNRALFLIDLAFPRDLPEVDPLQRKVYLYNLNYLSFIANENLSSRKSEIEKANNIIESKVSKIWLQLNSRYSYSSN